MGYVVHYEMIKEVQFSCGCFNGALDNMHCQPMVDATQKACDKTVCAFHDLCQAKKKSLLGHHLHYLVKEHDAVKSNWKRGTNQTLLHSLGQCVRLEGATELPQVELHGP
jgi:hypothetical protein